MTKPETKTYGEQLDPCVRAQTQKEFDREWDRLVAFYLSHGNSPMESIAIARENLSYYSGYGSLETNRRVVGFINRRLGLA